MPEAKAVRVKEVSWPQVVLISVVSLSLFASVTVLALAGQDVGAVLSAISAFLVLIIGALGFGKSQSIDTKIDHVTDLSNGRLDAVLADNKAVREDNKQLHEQITALALQVNVKVPGDNNTPPTV